MLGSSAVAVDQSTPRILTLDPIRSEHTDDELSNLSCCRQTARNGYVVQFSFFGSNVSPFFQILRAIAAILRARVSRAISARMPFLLQTLQIAAVRLGLTASRRCADEYFFQASIAVAIQSSSGNRFSAFARHVLLSSHTPRSYASPPPARCSSTTDACVRNRCGVSTVATMSATSNRPQLRNRSQQIHGSMLPALGQHRLLRLPPQWPQLIQFVHTTMPTRCRAPGSVSSSSHCSRCWA